jgi:hypothetical protein
MTDKGKPALEMLEEAVHLLRSMPAAGLCLYYIGALPFVLGFLYFWADMSASPFAQDHAGLGSLLVVLLFVWMNCWQTAFVAELRARLAGNRSERWTLQRIGRVAVVQGGIQPTCFLLLPVAALVALPFARVFAFYQSVNCYSGDEGTNFTSAVRTARKQAALWPLQNWIVLSLVSLLYLVCYLNFVLVIFNGAYLVKSFFGFETMFTRSVWSMINSTFFSTVSALTYLAVDPVVKAVYALRCFYGEALSTGEDLRARLRRIPGVKAAAAVLLAAILMTSAHAETVSTEQLNRAMDKVIQQPQFSWRMPRETQPQGENTGILHAAEVVIRGLGDMAEQVKRGIEALLDWYKKTFGSRNDAPDLPSLGGGAVAGMRFLTIFLVTSMILLAGFVIYRVFSGRVRPQVNVESRAAIPVDIASDTAVADQLPEEDWLRMGRELLAAGDVRLGVRALYLGALANLARRELISLTRSKTNRDYQKELERRGRATPHVLPAFVHSVSIYERTWYGRHSADGNTIAELIGSLDRMRADA